MDQHPIPRQITTFEFKLIGFLTLKQFLYLVICAPVAFILFKFIPIPLVNILLAALAVLAGVAFAFVPINDRPFDVWVKNLVNRLFSPTQYIYKKEAAPLYFLQNLYFLGDPHLVMTHIESKEKLANYQAKQTQSTVDPHKQNISNLLSTPISSVKQSSQGIPNQVSTPVSSGEKQPFFAGVIKNNKGLAIPSVMIYIKDEKGVTLRLLKTNPHGVFATFKPLASADYTFEVKDPNGRYFFDTMKIKIENNNPQPIEIFSKELI